MVHQNQRKRIEKQKKIYSSILYGRSLLCFFPQRIYINGQLGTLGGDGRGGLPPSFFLYIFFFFFFFYIKGRNKKEEEEEEGILSLLLLSQTEKEEEKVICP